jgi:hypothetical protein
MLGRASQSSIALDVAAQRRNERFRSTFMLLVIGVITLVTAATAYSTSPRPFSLALLGLVLVTWAAFVRPELGVYAIVLFSLMGDNETTPWWPFTQNLSQRESIFFISDQLPFTPLDLVLGAAWTAFLLRSLVDPQWRFRRGRVLTPALLFGVFVLFGIVNGVVNGGDRNAAFFEFRPLVYVVALYALIPNVLLTKRQFRIAFILAMVAVSLQSIFALGYYRSLSDEARSVLEALSEHTASVTMNVVFILIFGLRAFGAPRGLRRITFVGAIPVIVTYFLAQRRAAVVALFFGLIVLAVVLFYQNRRAFLRVVPILAGLLVAFIVVTWNASGAIGLPATAAKSVLFPDALAETDRMSSEYRDIENFNLWFTIRSNPIFGLGFGQKFLVVQPMPNISFFAMWQYFSHNSVLWVWIKTGFFGFAAMLFMFARVIQHGAHAALRRLRPADVAIVVAALSYPVMFLVFAYVDIAFSIRPTIVLALCFAICADFESAADDEPLPGATLSTDEPEAARAVA